MTTIRDLPQDILLYILDFLDLQSRLQTGLVSKFISSLSIQKLWHTPLCKTPFALKLLISTLNKSNTIYPYHDWIMGLSVSLEIMQTLPEDFFPAATLSTTIPIKTLQLVNVHASATTCQYVCNFFISGNIRDIRMSSCCNEMISHLSTRLALIRAHKLIRLSIQDCHITDPWVRQVVSWIPQLRYFSSLRSGYMSDTAILAITQKCPFIEIIIVTLPNHIIQSNTITMLSLQSLSQCLYLKKFICRGQVRIATRGCQDWLYANCPTLEYCDLSF